MDIAHLIAHPEELNHETIYDLRRTVAVYPTYHAARILLLKNLFLLHDPGFDNELRRAAVILPDRSILFDITQQKGAAAAGTTEEADSTGANGNGSAGQPQKKYRTTLQLLENFLDKTPAQPAKRTAKADPSVDYMAYLMENEGADGAEATPDAANGTATPEGRTRLDSLIDNFIDTHTERTALSENPIMPENIIDDETGNGTGIFATGNTDAAESTATEGEESDTSFTETLARVYIKQQKYERAAEMLQRLKGTSAARNNPYYTDQVRFLQKAIINERHRKGKGRKN